ncbi:MAG: glutathione S-transferase [Pseudomonadota bacterium]
MAVTLHHLNQSRSERIIWLLEELGAPYEMVRYERDAATRLAPPQLADIHPLGKAPLLEADGAVIAETGAIAHYLLERFDTDYHLHPKPGDLSRPAFLEWMHAAEGAAFLPFLMNTYLTGTGLTDSLLGAYMQGERAKALSVIEGRLKDNAYFTGEAFSAADCMMGFQLENAARAGMMDDASPVHDWLERIKARPAHAAMREKA